MITYSASVNWALSDRVTRRVFLIQVAKDSYSYYVTFVSSCNISLWNIYLYLAEWRTCVVIKLSDGAVRQYLASDTTSRGGSASLWLSELAQDPRIQMAVWMGLLVLIYRASATSVKWDICTEPKWYWFDGTAADTSVSFARWQQGKQTLAGVGVVF